MLTDVRAVRAYFAKLGLEQEIADLYLALYTHGPQTISALSRTSGIERTRIYRLIDQLLDSNLIELEAQGKRGIIKAAPVSNLRILINQREQELRNLTDELELIEQVLARNSVSYGQSRVQVFPGPEGLKQMRSNESKAENAAIYTYDTHSCHVYDDVVACYFTDYGLEIHDARIADMLRSIPKQ